MAGVSIAENHIEVSHWRCWHNANSRQARGHHQQVSRANSKTRRSKFQLILLIEPFIVKVTNRDFSRR